jgi:hypothetical protein
LAEMSIFTDAELHIINSIKLEDELFPSLGLVEYYENEADRYEFFLKLKEILPFDLLNKSSKVRAENLAETDSIREAFINTLILSAYVDSEDPITVSMPDLRSFLADMDKESDASQITDRMEDVVLEIIQELGEDLDEHSASILTREVLRIAQKLLDTIMTDWQTVSSPSAGVFYKRWSRMVILGDAPDPLERILTSGQMLDEFDLEVLLNRILRSSKKEVQALIKRIPWNLMLPDQILRIFATAEGYQGDLAKQVDLEGFSAGEIIDLIEEMDPKAVKKLMPTLEAILPRMPFSFEELELLSAQALPQIWTLVRWAGPPEGYGFRQIIGELKGASENHKQLLFQSSVTADFFPEFLREVFPIDSAFVKKQMGLFPASEIGPLFLRLNADKPPRSIPEGGEADADFDDEILDALFTSLPITKKRGAIKYFSGLK